MLEVVAPQTGPELDRAAQRGDGVGAGRISAGAVVGVANNRVALKAGPVSLEVAARIVREGTLIDQGRNGIAHFIGPSVLLDQFEPGARVDSLAIDVGTDTAGLFHKQLLDGVSSSHCGSYPFKSELRNCKPITDR